MKKIILAALLLLVFSVSAFAASEIMIGTPTVDGILEDMYLESYKIELSGAKDVFHTSKGATAENSKDNSATAYYLYDDTRLYVCVDVKDKDVFSRGKSWIYKNIAALSWENDAVEARVYYPELGEAVQANQYIFQCDAKGIATTNYLQMCDGTHYAATTLNENGYTVEFSIPLSFEKKAGDEIGLAIEIDDLHESVQGANTGMGKYNFNAYGSQHPYRNMVKLGTTKAVAKLTEFADTKNHAAKEDISYVVQADLFNGTDKGFEPNATMTRAMFATVIGRLYEIKVGPLTEYDSAVKFKDVDYASWYGKYVDWASGAGIVNGVGDSKFNPEAPVSKQEMAVMLFRFTKAVHDKTDIAFADKSSVASWAANAISYCAENGYIKGDKNNKFYPTSKATRAEVASLLSAYMKDSKAKLFD